MTYVVMKLLGLATGEANFADGKYLMDFDPDFHNGLGGIWTTPIIEKARRFPDSLALFQHWKTTSTVRPVRDDGRPNRPLTAYSIEPVTVEE